MRGSDRTAPACNGECDDRRADSSPATEHGRLLSLESRESLRLRDAGFERGAEGFAHGLQLDAVQDVLEEAADDQALRFLTREATRHQVEELLAVDLAERGAVRTAD